MNYLPTSSCQRSLWTAPKIDWKESQETSKIFVRKFREEATKVNLSLIFRKDKGYLRVEIEWHLNQGWHDLYVFTIWNRVTFEFPIPLQGQSFLNSHWMRIQIPNSTSLSFWGPLCYVRSDKGYLVLYRVIRLLLHLSRDTGPAERFKSWLGHPYIVGITCRSIGRGFE